MGAQSSQLFDDFQYLETNFTDALGNHEIYKREKDGMRVIGKKVHLPNQKLVSIKGKHLMATHGTTFSLKNIVMDSQKNNLMFVEFQNISLSDLILQRKSNGRIFNENEIYNLTSQILNGLTTLHTNNIGHGDIRPQTIFYDKAKDILKIYNQELLRGASSGMRLSVKGQIQALLAPEQLKAIIYGENFHAIDQLKADIFSLGMTILEIASLQPSILCYDKDFRIMKENVKLNLDSVQANYSNDLYELILKLLEIDPANRPNAVQVYNFLPQSISKSASFSPISFNRINKSNPGTPIKGIPMVNSFMDNRNMVNAASSQIFNSPMTVKQTQTPVRVRSQTISNVKAICPSPMNYIDFSPMRTMNTMKTMDNTRYVTPPRNTFNKIPIRPPSNKKVTIPVNGNITRSHNFFGGMKTNPAVSNFQRQKIYTPNRQYQGVNGVNESNKKLSELYKAQQNATRVISKAITTESSHNGNNGKKDNLTSKIRALDSKLTQALERSSKITKTMK